MWCYNELNTQRKKMKKTFCILRWIFFFPAAVFSSWLAFYLTIYIVKFCLLMQGFDGNFLLNNTWIRFIANACMGAAFLYTGTRIAPSRKRAIIWSLSIIGCLVTVGAIYSLIIAGDYWPLIEASALIVGITGMAQQLLGELRVVEAQSSYLSVS